MEYEKFVEFFIKINKKKILETLQQLLLIHPNMYCEFCLNLMKKWFYNQNFIGFSWMGMDGWCSNKLIRISVRKKCIFESIKVPFKTTIKVIIQWCWDRQQLKLLETMSCNKSIYLKIFRLIYTKIRISNTINKI